MSHDKAGRAYGLCLTEGVARLSPSVSLSYVVKYDCIFYCLSLFQIYVIAFYVYFNTAISTVLNNAQERPKENLLLVIHTYMNKYMIYWFIIKK